jgi:hypothetical protein
MCSGFIVSVPEAFRLTRYYSVLLCVLVLTDADCVGSLTCFQRPGVEAVPGCIGEGESDYDYCIQS